MSHGFNYISRVFGFDNDNNGNLQFKEQSIGHNSKYSQTIATKIKNKTDTETINNLFELVFSLGDENKDLFEIGYSEIQFNGTTREISYIIGSSDFGSLCETDRMAIQKEIEVNGFKNIKIAILTPNENLNLNNTEIAFLRKNNLYKSGKIDSSFFDPEQIFENFESYEDLKIIHEIYKKAKKKLCAPDTESANFLNCINNLLRIGMEKKDENLINQCFFGLSKFLKEKSGTFEINFFSNNFFSNVYNLEIHIDDIKNTNIINKDRFSILTEVVSLFPSHLTFRVIINNCDLVDVASFFEHHTNKIENLTLKNCKNQSAFNLKSLGGLENLNSLELYGWKAPFTLEKNNKIEYLGIHNCKSDIIDFKIFSNLKDLEISSDNTLIDANIITNMGNLNTLKISHCNNLKTFHLANCSNLIEIKIAKCPHLKGPVRFKNVPNLEILQITSCPLKTSPDVSKLLNLQKINLKGTNIVDPPSTEELQNLYSIELKNCPNLDPIKAKKYYESSLPEAIDLRRKCEGRFVCTQKIYDPDSEGYFYGIKEGQIILYDNDYLFPAVQPTNKASIEIGDLAESLGYSEADEAFFLPDVNVLNHRWKENKLQNIQLKFLGSEGIADDKTFIKIFLDGYLLVSLGSEFVHDHFAHILKTLHLIEQSIDIDISKNDPIGTHFNKVMNQFRDKVRQVNNFLNKLERHNSDDLLLKELRTCLGMTVDIATSLPSLKMFERFSLKKIAEIIITDEKWVKYLSKKYGEVEYKNNAQKLSTAWHYIASNVENSTPLSHKGLIRSLQPINGS